MENRILIVCNNSKIFAEIQRTLSEAATIVDVAFSSSEAIDLFLHYDYSLILLDAGMDGKEIVKPLRTITQVPILALCGQNSSKDRCALLEAGASACLTKPIDLQECVAQIKSLLNLYFATSEKRGVRTIAFGTFLFKFSSKKFIISTRKSDEGLFVNFHSREIWRYCVFI